MAVEIKRAYEEPEEADGYRILVDRIWPRGISRKDLHLDEWMRDIAPSEELRRWFGHEPGKFKEFARRYIRELEQISDQVTALIRKARKRPVTLVYSAKDKRFNQAVVLRSYLRRKLKS